MLSRIIFLSLLLLSVFWLPWWFSIILGLIGMIRYRHFYEVVFPALCFDFLYSTTGAAWVGFSLEFSVFSLVAVYLLEDLKKIILIERW